MTADEYIEKVTKSFTASGSVTASFLQSCADYESQNVFEIKRHETPSFQNIVDTCNRLLQPFSGKLLILFDEVGSIGKDFFKNTENGDSYFETLMNQFRTLPYVRTKLAVYPHSYSDILKETRYGDAIELECDITNNSVQYRSFMTKTVSLIERYVEKASGLKCQAEEVFDISVENQILIEQLINASEGNMRRLVHLLDSSMSFAFSRCHGRDRVIVDDVLDSLSRQGSEMESLYQDMDRDFLGRLAKVCRSRSTYRFTFPNKSTLVNKYTSLSEEYNVINIRQAGSGRQSTVYSFDYAYCVYKDIPTHYVKDSERIDRSRSSISGEPIKRVAQLSDELLIQSEMRGKIEGKVVFVGNDPRSGFAETDENKSYFITMDSVIKSDKKDRFYIGEKVRFVPTKLDETSFFAKEIEILR